MAIVTVLAFVFAVLRPKRDPKVERLTRERDEARAEVKSLRREVEEARSAFFTARDRPTQPNLHGLLDRAVAQDIMAQAQQAQVLTNPRQAQHLVAYQHAHQNQFGPAYQHAHQNQFGPVAFCNCVPDRGEFLFGRLAALF
jgi:hypothetical protein